MHTLIANTRIFFSTWFECVDIWKVEVGGKKSTLETTIHIVCVTLVWTHLVRTPTRYPKRAKTWELISSVSGKSPNACHTMTFLSLDCQSRKYINTTESSMALQCMWMTSVYSGTSPAQMFFLFLLLYICTTQWLCKNISSQTRQKLLL